MKFTELQNRDAGELQVILQEQRVSLGKLRFELASKTLKDFSKLEKTKRSIAKIMTAMRLQATEGERSAQRQQAAGMKMAITK